MTYTLPQVTDASIIALEGEIGPAAVIALQRRIIRALDSRHPRIVVDVTGATGPGGATLQLFCGALRFVSRCGATLALAGCPAEMRRAIDLCGLRGVEFHPTVHAALTAGTTSRALRTDTVHTRRTSATTKGLRQHA